MNDRVLVHSFIRSIDRNLIAVLVVFACCLCPCLADLNQHGMPALLACSRHAPLRYFTRRLTGVGMAQARRKALGTATMEEEELKDSVVCHKLACAIQDCLARNSYQQPRCTDAIEAYNQCVARDKQRRQQQLQQLQPPQARS